MALYGDPTTRAPRQALLQLLEKKGIKAYQLMRGQCAWCGQWLGPSCEKQCKCCGAPREAAKKVRL